MTKNNNFKIKKLEPGDKYYWLNILYHIVNIFEDGEYPICVSKYYIKGRGWSYTAEYLENLIFKICLTDSNMCDKSNKKHFAARRRFFELNGFEYE